MTPGLYDYFPPKSGYKQYRCPHCQAWLHTSRATNQRSAFTFVIVGSIGLLTIVNLRETLSKGTVILLLIAFLAALFYVVGSVARGSAEWEAEP
jgi:predicted membrane channel-forming protein YqfA (hemolysin III family)